MSFKLGLSLNPFVNRFAEPRALIDVLAGEIGIGRVQLVHEFIDPNWPVATVHRLTEAMAKACADRGVRITSLMTGPYGRLNNFGHPDAEVREYAVRWFKGLVDIAAGLDCPAAGTQYAILTYRDYDDPVRRQAIMDAALDCWRRLADHAAKRGLTSLFWEPMSVGREIGHTIDETIAVQNRLEAASLAVPMFAMIDIDHGDVSSANPDDYDPYAWAKTFAARSPIIHIKQSSANKGGHWPFTAEHNLGGKIVPEKLIAAIRAGGGDDNELCMEFAYREREPADRSVIATIKESVAFWKPFADTGLVH